MSDSVNITIDNLDDYTVTVVDGENITVSLQGILSLGGGSGPVSTDELAEGITNLYYTEARVANTISSGITTSSIHITGMPGNTVINWNTEDSTYNFPLSDNVSLQLGQEQVTYVRNNSGVTIPNGYVMKVTGSSGTNLTVSLADNSDSAGADTTLAIATEDILNNSFGFGTTHGLIRGINTSSFLPGDRLYLGLNGQITNIEPITPKHVVTIGYVVRSHATEGSIFADIHNGWHLTELHDVLTTNPTNGQALIYDQASSTWVNGNVTLSETLTTLSTNLNTLVYTDENGAQTVIDLTPYLDNTNLAYIVSGVVDGNGIATFTRDDASTFTVDMSILLDDTNLSRITTAAWNTTNGVLTLTRNDATTVTVDLDGRYIQQDFANIANWDTAYSWGNHSLAGYLTSETDPVFTASPAGGIVAGNIANWNTAYLWGDHSTQGYLTTISLNDVSDVIITTPTSGQVVSYNGTNWVNTTPVSGLNDLTDVDLTTPATNGQVLAYNSVSSKFEPANQSGGGVADVISPLLLAGL